MGTKKTNWWDEKPKQSRGELLNTLIGGALLISCGIIGFALSYQGTRIISSTKVIPWNTFTHGVIGVQAITVGVLLFLFAYVLIVCSELKAIKKHLGVK